MPCRKVRDREPIWAACVPGFSCRITSHSAWWWFVLFLCWFVLSRAASCCFVLLRAASCCFVLRHAASSCFVLLRAASCWCEARMKMYRWAEAHIKIARMTLTIKLDGNWSSFQLANSAPPLSVTDSAIAPSARILGCRALLETGATLEG